jgi:hypothetical protein
VCVSVLLEFTFNFSTSTGSNDGEWLTPSTGSKSVESPINSYTEWVTFYDKDDDEPVDKRSRMELIDLSTMAINRDENTVVLCFILCFILHFTAAQQ